MFCQSCGMEIHESSRFCRHCGAGTAVQREQQGFQSRQPGMDYGTFQQPAPAAFVVQPQPKSRLAAGLLAILIGHLGIHNFYLGFTNKAVAQLLISVLSCGFLLFVSWVWAVIEGIMILTDKINTDANGIPFRD